MPTILAIDDRQDNLLSLSALLKSMIPGCRVITALSGKDGIEKAKTYKPDTILLDLHMPVMDGFETCQHLKTNPAINHIPVIMLTAVSTNSESRVKGLETGADAFLAKPVDRFELAAQVKAMLRIKNAEDSLRHERDKLKNKVQVTSKELEERAQFMQMVFEGTGDGIWDWDMKNSSITMNDEWIRILGYRPGERKFNLHWWYSNVHPDNKPAFEKSLNAYLDGHTKYYELEYRIRTKSGDYKWIWTRGFCIKYDMSGKPLRMIGTHRDISDKKKAGEERAVLEAQLQQAQKMEAIGTLAGGIAHDFNNILYPIIGYTEMMLYDVQEGSEYQKNLKEILAASFRARDLVQQILTFSRQAEKKQKPLKVQIIIREILKLMKSTLPATITIDQHIDKNCNMVLADPTHIHQIAMNLITNAFHAMEEDGGVLGVTLTEIELTPQQPTDLQLNPGSYICLSISDTGYGIDEYILDRIFDPYFTTKKEGKGTGLGLSVVHGIVKSYGGDIKVSSVCGKGSVFRIYLPIIESIYEETTPKIEQKIVMGKDEHILLVDDEEPILIMEKQMLERLGYRVTSKTSSMAALETFQTASDQFDLIITDMTMPNMTGEKLASALKQIRKDIPVILCTGFSDKISKEKAGSMGINGFLLKPIVKNELSQTVRSVLDSN